MRITFLGTGTSHGVPTIDCMMRQYAHCPHQVCLKAVDNLRHRRLRASIYIEFGENGLLMDTSQDFREQMLRAQITHLDAILYTHGHADHIYGLPDTRSYSHQLSVPLPIYGSTETLGILRHSFEYVFRPPEFVGGGIPVLAAHELNRPMVISGELVQPIHVEHGPLEGCQGYRLGKVAYIPDGHRIPPESLALLEGLDLLILNCLRPRPHSSHLSLAESLAYVELLQPRQALFTHMTHDIDYEFEEPNLPANVRFAYDGLQVTL
ncbi:MAG: MBL fold metallo-hydrolase [Anaerolineae bacterium]